MVALTKRQQQTPSKFPGWITKCFTKKTEHGECLACTEAVPKKKLIDLSCKHSYCNDCFNTLVETCVTSANFPPKCCDEHAIPHKTAMACCNPTVLKLYLVAQILANIPAKSRWYCPDPTCSFLHDKRKMDVAHGAICCKKCKKYGCIWCKTTRTLLGHACVEGAHDPATKAVLEMAELNGWKQCFGCGSMVEKIQGCRCMTCTTCKAKFCYSCGGPWPDCVSNTECDRVHAVASRKQRGKVHDVPLDREIEYSRRQALSHAQQKNTERTLAAAAARQQALEEARRRTATAAVAAAAAVAPQPARSQKAAPSVRQPRPYAYTGADLSATAHTRHATPTAGTQQPEARAATGSGQRPQHPSPFPVPAPGPTIDVNQALPSVAQLAARLAESTYTFAAVQIRRREAEDNVSLTENPWQDMHTRRV